MDREKITLEGFCHKLKLYKAKHPKGQVVLNWDEDYLVSDWTFKEKYICNIEMDVLE